MQTRAAPLTFLCLLLACLPRLHAAPAKRGTPDPAQTTGDRTASLLMALESLSAPVRHRAVQELSQSSPTNEVFVRTVVRLLATEADFEALQLMPALARSGPAAVPCLVETLRASTARESAGLPLLLTLGRIGAKARDAAPFLREELANEKNSPRYRATVRIVLLSVVSPSAEEIQIIRRVLRERTPEAEAAINVMGLVGIRNWADSETAQELTDRLLGQPGDVSAYAALAVGSMGAEAAKCADGLARAVKNLPEEFATLRIPYGVSLARLYPEDSRKRKDALRETARYLGEAANQTDFAAAILIAHTVLDDNLAGLAVQLLEDSDEAVQRGAMRILAAVGAPSPRAAEGLLAVLAKSRNADLRKDAALCLASVLPVADMPLLDKRASEEKDGAVADALQDSLSVVSLGQRQAASPSLAVLSTANRRNPQEVISLLNDLETQEAATEALRRLAPDIVPHLLRALTNAAPELRSGAAYGLGRLADTLTPAQKADSVQSLARSLEDPDSAVRWQAAGALVFFAIDGPHAENAVPALTKALDDPSRNVRRRAADALAKIGEPATNAVQPLIRGLRDTDEAVRRSAATALGEIGPAARESFTALVPLLQDESVRAAAVLAVSRVNTNAAEVIPLLTGVLSAPQSEWDMACSFSAQALAGYGAQAAPALLPLLDHKNALTRLWATAALAGLGPSVPAVLPALEKCAKDSDPKVRQCAEQALSVLRESPRPSPVAP